MNARGVGAIGSVPPNELVGRVAAIEWPEVEADLDAQGAAVIKGLLAPVDCHELSSLYQRDDIFRARVVMARHGFGRGEYRYFDYPLPPLIGVLRESLYAHLAPVANRWYDAMGMTARFPDRHSDFIDRCHAAGQEKPTPLLLQYAAGDYNCLHQDLYGEHVFPLQVAVLLEEPGRDFRGGEFVLSSSARACRRAHRSSTCARAMRWCLPSTIARCAARAVSTASTCATVSVKCAPGIGTPWESSSTTRTDGVP